MPEGQVAASETGAEGGDPAEIETAVDAGGADTGGDGAAGGETAEETVARLNGTAGGDEPHTEEHAEEPPDEEIDFPDLGKFTKAQLTEALKLAKDADEIRRGSYAKFEEAAQARKEALALVEALRQDPMAVLGYLHKQGHLQKSPEEIAYEAVQRATEELRLSPEERVAAQRARDLESREARANEWEQRQRQQWEAHQQRQYEMQLDKELTAAFDELKVPKSLDMVKRVGLRLHSLAQQGVAADPQMIRAAARDAVGTLSAEVESLAGNLQPETLRRMFPKLTDALRKASLAQVTARKPPPTAATVGKDGKQPIQKPKAAPGYGSFREMRDALLTPDPDFNP